MVDRVSLLARHARRCALPKTSASRAGSVAGALITAVRIALTVREPAAAFEGLTKVDTFVVITREVDSANVVEYGETRKSIRCARVCNARAIAERELCRIKAHR